MRYTLEYTEDNLHSDLKKIIAYRKIGRLSAFEALEKIQKAIAHYQVNN